MGFMNFNTNNILCNYLVTSIITHVMPLTTMYATTIIAHTTTFSHAFFTHHVEIINQIMIMCSDEL